MFGRSRVKQNDRCVKCQLMQDFLVSKGLDAFSQEDDTFYLQFESGFSHCLGV